VSGRPGADTAPRGGGLFPIAAGSIFAVIGGVAILDATDTWNADWRIVLGAMVIATGALTVVGAATGRRVGAVVLLDTLLVLALALALFVRVPLFAGIGDRTAHPTSIAALAGTYRLGIGDYTVNLADVPVPVGETHVKATLGIGDLEVHVPYGIKVVVDARASAGQVVIFGDESDGTSVHKAFTGAGADPSRVLVLDAHVGVGRVEVTRG